MPAESPKVPKLLIVDDELEVRESLRAFLLSEFGEIEVLTTDDPEEALGLLEQEPIDLVISDHRMPGMRGLEFLDRVGQVRPEAIRWLMTGLPEVDLARRSLNDGGVQRFFTKPLDPDDILSALRSALDDGLGG